ncbi:MAG TPA: DUF1553 domain-containing protein [Candidatus Limnocylindria bacterium]|nr:DUF1553 domain-containing protein [Candidatus Limnocylindria bacterium]
MRRIFSDNCYACHGPDKNKRKAGLRLDVKEGALAKLESDGFAIVPGKPEQSALLKSISLPVDDDDHMPPAKTGKQLSREQIDLLRRWIEQGARWAEHWAYVAPERPPVPEVKNKKWARNNIDRFVLAELEKKKFTPNKDADRSALIRRASLDLVGLPPTVEEVDVFLADKTPDAYEKVVDRLLASPHFGERMALAWLDQARYADSSGYHFDGFRQMHLWRDWVIKSFNENKPFDQFTVEQIAGDLLPNATVDQKIATGFHRNVMTTDEGGVDPEEYMAKYQVDRVSTTAQVWLGTTLGCAECHDHKYDPLSQREFYQFYAFFNGIPEKGLDGTRVKNPAPVLRIPSPEQGSKLLRYLDQIPAAEKTLAEREAELPKAQEKWEKDLPEVKEPKISVLAAAFTFDETVDGFSARSPANSTNANITKVVTNPSAFSPGKLGHSLTVISTNDFVELGQAVTFEFTNTFSYGAWIKHRGKTGAVLSKMEESPGYRGFDLLIADQKVEVHLVNKFPGNAIKVASKETLPTNTWTHVFVTYDGSKKASGVNLYIDGRIAAVDTPNDKLSASIATEAPLLIGSRIKDFPFQGLIDDVRFYDRALKPEEVLELFAYPNLLTAKLPAEKRDKEQATALKKFFREHRATDFLAARARLDTLQKEKKDLLDKIPDSMVMEEMEKPRDTFVLVRGNYQSKGEKVTAGTPKCWPPLPSGEPANRLSLARWLVAPNNPLTARVTVNRYWAMFFGTGLVKTSNDFGSQGDRPSHPELLDWLADEFMSPHGPQELNRISGTWDIKRIVRLIATSAAYRQSAVVNKEKLERDPYNRLLTRGPRLRLDAEIIRDNALAVSGLLNSKIGGPSIKPYQPPGIWSGTDHTYEQSKGEDLYRRGLYVFWKRAAHYPSFQTFDAPSRETCTLLRPRTSTPLQSLVVMNDPVYVEASRALAARALYHGGDSLRQQLIFAFRVTLGRAPRSQEVKVLEKTFREQHDRFNKDKAAAFALLSVGESPRPIDLDAVDLAAMSGVANVLLNLNETLTR